MKRKKLKALVLTMAAALALSVFVPAMAPVNEVYATKKVKSTWTLKKAKSVKKGTTIVSVPKRTSKSSRKQITAYVKFKAPKKGTYVFTFSNFKGKDPYDNMSAFAYYRKNGHVRSVKFKSDSGNKYSTRNIISKDLYNRLYAGQKNHYTSTYFKLKMKKNQTIYIYTIHGSNKAYSYKLKIKKK